MIRLLFFIVILIKIIAEPSYSLAEYECELEDFELEDFESYELYSKFLNDEEKKELHEYCYTVKKVLAQQGLDICAQAYLMNIAIIRKGSCSCSKSTIRPKFKEWLEEKAWGEPLIRVYQQFCKDTCEVTDSNILSGRKDWLQKEIFCQMIRIVANSTGWKVLAPDLPSLKILQEEARLICDNLRNDKISLVEAQYRWDQEWYYFEQDVGLEITRKGMKGIFKFYGSVFKFFLDIVK